MFSYPISSGFQSSQKSKFLFDIDDYKLIKKINKGGCAIVHLVQNKKNGKYYAAKTNLHQITKQNMIYISREIRVLIEVQHPTIIQFRGFSYIDFYNLNNITILMDYMQKGSLADLIENEEKSLCQNVYDNTKRQIILIGIARGMMILNKLHIINRDLKPENILIDDDYHPHITDFGLSKFLDPQKSIKQTFGEIGTLAYMAPEVIDKNQFSTKSDVYAFGILMYEVVTGKRAYKNELYHKNINKYNFEEKVIGGYRPEIKGKMIKKGFQIMIEKCWSANPSERPTFSELYRKLSLTGDGSIFDLMQNGEDDVINYEDEDEEDEISTTFCFDSVNFDEIFDYVKKVDVEEKTFNESKNECDEIANLKKEVDNLKLKTEMQEEMISSLEEQNMLQYKLINDLKYDIKQLKNQYKQQNNDDHDQSLIGENFAYDEEEDDTDHFQNGIFGSLINTITMTYGGSTRPSCSITNLAEDDKTHFFYNSYNYNPSSENDSFIKFDFGENIKVDLYSYFICTNDGEIDDCHPKSWRIEGSNDDLKWSDIDKREDENCAFLNSSIKSIVIPSSLTELKDGWCRGTSKLTNVTIAPDNLRFVYLPEKITNDSIFFINL